jgi:hypothetical protein
LVPNFLFVHGVLSRGKVKNLQQILIGQSFPAIQMFARRQFREFLQVFRSQGIRNGMLFTKPFSEVNQFTATGAKWPISAFEPFPYLLARGTFYL